ncbi:MAG: Rrf2 family transcriptional regulator [Acidimicrobiales bacterium]|nr:Rrf2 family transcriptional regulator [Acidimicrobiales bacterium]
MRLEVSRRADLATRALLVLGRSGRRSKSPELARRVGTTPGFLSQVMAPLVARRWVRSDPGPTGGYAAVVDLDAVSVLDVIEAVEGPTDAGRCVLEDRACSGAGPCALHVPWSRARAQLLGELAGTPLSSLAAGEAD